MQHNLIKHVGLDIHARTITVAVAEPGVAGEVRLFGQIANDPAAVAKLAGRLASRGESLTFWYEAGPCGYGVYRQLLALGHACTVVAPSLIPRKSGDRVKTDRRDALSLARLGRAGELTSVWVPGPEQEAIRDLTRCREDAKNLQRQSRQQLSSFLLRHGRHYDQRRWTQTHQRWLMKQKFESSVQELVYQDYLGQVDQATQRVAELEKQIAAAAQQWSLWPVAQALMALRGVDLLTAVTLLAELGDLTRFDSPRQLMAHLGLTPCEHSSGQTRRQGGITKTGNAHARRVMGEAAWAYRYHARMSAPIRARARHAPPSVQAIAWKAQRRLCGRYRALVDTGKKQVVAVTAVARELSGFIWAIAWEVKRLELGSAGGEPSSAA